MLNEEFHWNPPNLYPSMTSYIIAFQKWFSCVKTKMAGSGYIFSAPREDCVSLVMVNLRYWECDSFSKCKGRIKMKVFFFPFTVLHGDIPIFCLQTSNTLYFRQLWYKCDNILLEFLRCYCADVVGADEIKLIYHSIACNT